MFTLIFLIFKQASIRARLIAGISVLVVLILILGCSFILLTAFGPHRYANKDAVFFLSLKTQLNDNQYGIKIINTILKPFELSDLDRRLIKNELAVLCHSPNKIFYCNLIIKTDKPKELENYLSEKELSFVKKEKDLFVVGRSSEKIKKSYNPFNYLKFRSLLSNPPIFITLRPPLNLHSEAEKILGTIKKPIKLKGATTNSQLTLRAITLFNKKEDSSIAEPIESEVDLIINLNEASALFLALESIIGIKLDEALKEKIKPAKGDLIAKRNENSNSVLNHFNFKLTLKTVLTEEEQEKLINYLITNLNLLYPKISPITLEDGTVIPLLVKNNQLTTEKTASGFIINLPNNENIEIIQSESDLIVKSDDIEKDFNLGASQPTDQLFFRLNSWPKDQWPRELLNQEFSFLRVLNEKIILE